MCPEEDPCIKVVQCRVYCKQVKGCEPFSTPHPNLEPIPIEPPKPIDIGF